MQKREGLSASPLAFNCFANSYEAELAADDRLFNCETTAENADEIAPVKAPLVRPNTRATRIATNAKMAPYSVIPCPDSS